MLRRYQVEVTQSRPEEQFEPSSGTSIRVDDNMNLRILPARGDDGFQMDGFIRCYLRDYGSNNGGAGGGLGVGVVVDGGGVDLGIVLDVGGGTGTGDDDNNDTDGDHTSEQDDVDNDATATATTTTTGTTLRLVVVPPAGLRSNARTVIPRRHSTRNTPPC